MLLDDSWCQRELILGDSLILLVFAFWRDLSFEMIIRIHDVSTGELQDNVEGKSNLGYRRKTISNVGF